MKNLSKLALVITPLLLGLGMGVRQDDRPERDISSLTDEEKQEIMMQTMAVMGPGDEHEMLARYTGKWKQDVKAWMAPGGEPLLLSSESEAEMVLGGRFLITHGKGEFMGATSETMSIIGFDRRSGEFTIEAYDSFGTYSVGGRGPLSEDGKTAVMRGTDYDAIARYTQVYDFVMTFIDDDTWRFEIIFHDGLHATAGEPFKMVEVLNTRMKD